MHKKSHFFRIARTVFPPLPTPRASVRTRMPHGVSPARMGYEFSHTRRGRVFALWISHHPFPVHSTPDTRIHDVRSGVCTVHYERCPPLSPPHRRLPKGRRGLAKSEKAAERERKKKRAPKFDGVQRSDLHGNNDGDCVRCYCARRGEMARKRALARRRRPDVQPTGSPGRAIMARAKRRAVVRRLQPFGLPPPHHPSAR